MASQFGFRPVLLASVRCQYVLDDVCTYRFLNVNKRAIAEAIGDINAVVSLVLFRDDDSRSEENGRWISRRLPQTFARNGLLLIYLHAFSHTLPYIPYPTYLYPSIRRLYVLPFLISICIRAHLHYSFRHNIR